MEEQTPQPIGIEAENATTIVVNEPEIAASSSGNNPDAADDRPGVSGVHLLLMCLNTDRHVTFHEGVVDNEGMNRRKSKCCCIYRKPHVFGESSSSSDDECEHCCGHPEVRLRNRLKKQQQQQQQQQHCQCGCQQHRNHHHHPQPQQTLELVQHETNANTEIAGDSGNVKIKTESNTLLSASSQAMQHS
ncbi:E3 ubiquitin-protein ligase PPP1R11 [Drosophila albomicans]|uniref:E3 ubiquitin-protein ligase PPP1R11 n=1 Tax=Drosophila albomicans TaxID=7291 RepID=A0A6P8XYS3_DROAB|nr:E3 ubiquitin-protein ligase PPP1R11 [Drosophila albomicans]